MRNLNVVMEKFRETYDCRDLDENGSIPLLTFHVFEKQNGEWNKVSGEFYAYTLLEAVDQAHSWEGPFNGLLKAECVDVCEYFMDQCGDPHIILSIETLQLIHRGQYFQSLIPTLVDFKARVISRRMEMKEAGLL